jgi:sugar O-acyltransferase (sialic acid O-acetyltransferase NeuD family)
MKLIIWGAGGHGKVVLDVALAMNVCSEIAFLDDRPLTETLGFRGRQILNPDEGIAKLMAEEFGHFLVAIGDNHERARCFEAGIRHGLIPATLIHPQAIVSPSARVGLGTLVMPRVVINADATIGDNCILNTGAIVEHDCTVGDHVHLSPAAVLGGGAAVEPFAHLGIGAVALPGARIGESAVVGAGAVVLREVPRGVTAIGVPARVMALAGD